jgi:DnaJ-domain-containing protein 1
LARRFWKKMREEAANHPAPPRADEDNPWHEEHPTLRALQHSPVDEAARAEAYSDWAARMRDKQDRRRVDASDERAAPGSYWTTDALFAESRQVERDEAGTRANPWRVRELLAVLDLRDGASADEIGSAYRRLAKLHHPDRFIDADEATQEFHADRMRSIIEAYRALRAAAAGA